MKIKVFIVLLDKTLKYDTRMSSDTNKCTRIITHNIVKDVLHQQYSHHIEYDSNNHDNIKLIIVIKYFVEQYCKEM